MVSVNNLSVEFSAKPLFSDISFVINPSDKIALVGKNGAGKSTLLKILAKIQNPDSGVLNVPNDINIGYLPQEMKVSDSTTLLEETKKAFKERLDMEKEILELNKKLEVSTDYESEQYNRLLDRLEHLNHYISVDPLQNLEAETERTLLGLGFLRSDFNRPTSEFSGGWRMRIELAKILLRQPDLLLLDEPTNHLDIESIQWLEQFLKSKAKAVVLVSHDRAFLDNVTKRTIEISCGKIYDYKVKYTEFVKLRNERIEQQTKAFENQQKLIEETKDFIERFRYKATKAVQVQSRIKQLEKIVPIEIDEVDNSSLKLKFPAAVRSGDYPLIGENLAKSYADHNVFHNVGITLKRGDKVAFVGKNGEGKSTLVKCIMQQIPYEGNLKIGHNVSIAYFAQNQASLLDPSLTVFETIDNVATGDIRTKIKDILAAFLFRGEDIDKKVSVLSGGEKTRLAMIKLLLQPANFLILDEPTNHLDMRTKDVLKEAIKDFSGTVIVVSHDREFLDGLVEKVYEFSNGGVKENLGGIYDYLRKKNISSLDEIKSFPSASQDNNSSDDIAQTKESEKAKRINSYIEQKERDKIIRKAEKKLKNIEESIEKIEEKISELESQLSMGNSSIEILNEYEESRKQLDLEMKNWENAQMELEEIQNK